MTGGSLAMSAEAHASGRRDPRRCTRCLVCPGSSVHPGPLPPAMRRRMEQAGVARRFLNNVRLAGPIGGGPRGRAAGSPAAHSLPCSPRAVTSASVRPGPCCRAVAGPWSSPAAPRPPPLVHVVGMDAGLLRTTPHAAGLSRPLPRFSSSSSINSGGRLRFWSEDPDVDTGRCYLMFKKDVPYSARRQTAKITSYPRSRYHENEVKKGRLNHALFTQSSRIQDW